MVSILGDYNYTFPKPIKLEKKLKDMLEDDIEEKYFLSEKMIEFFKHNEEKQIEKGNGFRFNVSDGNVIAKTITTLAGNRMDDNFIKIKNATKKGYLEATDGDGVDISSRMEHHRGTVQKGKSQTLTTSCDIGVVNKDLRIRKLTPRECGRLMAVKDKDIDKLNLSDSAKYHIFGDAIVCTVLMSIFGEMLDTDYRSKVERWDYNDTPL